MLEPNIEIKAPTEQPVDQNKEKENDIFERRIKAFKELLEIESLLAQRTGIGAIGEMTEEKKRMLAELLQQAQEKMNLLLKQWSNLVLQEEEPTVTQAISGEQDVKKGWKTYQELNQKKEELKEKIANIYNETSERLKQNSEITKQEFAVGKELITTLTLIDLEVGLSEQSETIIKAQEKMKQYELALTSALREKTFDSLQKKLEDMHQEALNLNEKAFEEFVVIDAEFKNSFKQQIPALVDQKIKLLPGYNDLQERDIERIKNEIITELFTMFKI